MGTINTAIAAPWGDTDAHARLFWQAMHDFFATTCGLSLTSDTGQANLATITRSGTGNSERGYEMFKMTSSGLPDILIRVGYWMGGSASQAVINLTVGFTSDGAGNLTGTNKTGTPSTSTKFPLGNNASLDTNNRVAMGSGGLQRACLCVGTDSTDSNCAAWFSIERTKDASGADTNEGVIFGFHQLGGVGITWLWLPSSGSFQAESALTAVGTNNSSSAVGTTVHLGRPIPLAGAMKPPGRNLLCFTTADFSGGSSISVTVDGASHTYITIPSTRVTGVAGNFGSGGAANSRLALLFE